MTNTNGVPNNRVANSNGDLNNSQVIKNYDNPNNSQVINNYGDTNSNNDSNNRVISNSKVINNNNDNILLKIILIIASIVVILLFTIVVLFFVYINKKGKNRRSLDFTTSTEIADIRSIGNYSLNTDIKNLIDNGMYHNEGSSVFSNNYSPSSNSNVIDVNLSNDNIVYLPDEVKIKIEINISDDISFTSDTLLYDKCNTFISSDKDKKDINDDLSFIEDEYSITSSSKKDKKEDKLNISFSSKKDSKEDKFNTSFSSMKSKK